MIPLSPENGVNQMLLENLRHENIMIELFNHEPFLLCPITLKGSFHVYVNYSGWLATVAVPLGTFSH